MESLNQYKQKDYHVILTPITHKYRIFNVTYLLVPNKIWEKGYDKYKDLISDYPNIIDIYSVNIDGNILYNLLGAPRGFYYGHENKTTFGRRGSLLYEKSYTLLVRLKIKLKIKSLEGLEVILK